MKTEKFDVTGMTCAACVTHVEKSVSKLQGIKMVQVNLLSNSMTVSYDEQAIDNQAIEQSVENAGYHAFTKSENKSNDSNKAKVNHVLIEQQEMKQRWWISLAFLIPLLYLSMGHMFGLPLPDFFLGHANAITFAFTQLLLTLPIAFINKKYFVTGFKTLFKAAPNMDTLIAIGSSAAIIYGVFAIFRIGYGLGHADMSIVHQFTHDLYFESGATILTLITLGKYLEARSKSRTSEAISKLVDLVPKTAIVLVDNVEVELAVELLKSNDIIVVKSGQSVPVDGIIVSGNGNLDESALTGESMPVFKDIGQQVMSASINNSGYFTFKATKVGKDTTLAQIINLVEEASASKAPISKMADKISSIFVPVVIALSVLSTTVWMLLGYPFDFALSIGIAVLVISCPCALGLATPVAIMVGTGKGAEHGMLIKSAESLETAHKINTIVLDKTGTLTLGKPRITDIVVAANYTENELLKLAYALEKPSEHPLANAIVVEAEKRNLLLIKVSNFENIPGKGVKASIDDAEFSAGNQKFMTEQNINFTDFAVIAESMAEQGKTPLFFAKNKIAIGLIAVADVLKPTSINAIAELQHMGMEVIMLTGDHSKTAKYIQSLTGISTVISDVLPQDKEKEISRLQAEGRKVAMVGDGINDAPALVKSDLGIAIGAGTDIAIESADVVLMRNDLMDVVSTLQLSKSVIKNIKQNLFWAFFYNIIGIPLAAGVFYAALGWKLNPMFAAAAMSFSSVTVVLNALRLLKFKPKFINQSRNIATDIEPIQINSISLQNESSIPEKENSTSNKKMKFSKNQFSNIKYIPMKEKNLKISGMSCGHCSARVEKVLNAIDGIEAKVNLESNSAKLILSKDISNELIKTTIDNIGYEVTEITE